MKKRSTIALILGVAYLATLLLSAYSDNCNEACCAGGTTCPMENHEKGCPAMMAGTPIDYAPTIPVQEYDATIDLVQSATLQIIALTPQQIRSIPWEYSYPLLLVPLSAPLLI
jgi:hypothetical protein